MNDKFKFFQRIVAAPYLLALLGLLLPLMTVSCADKKVAEPSLYELSMGFDLETGLQEPAAGYLKKMQEGNPQALEKFKADMPNFPKMEPVYMLLGIVGALVLAAFFAFIAPYGYYASLGSLAMGILSMVSLWAFLSKMGELCGSMGLRTIGVQILKVEPGPGIYCASALILIGSAMNLASIARPVVEDFRAMRAKKSVKEKKV